MLQYKPIEVIPEDFFAVINKDGKNYYFTIFHNAAAIKYQAKWGNKSIGEIIAEIGEAALIGTVAYWLLSAEDRKDFKDENDFNEKIQPYYARQSDFNTKVLKAMSIGFIQEEIADKDTGAAADAARFPAGTEGGGNSVKNTKGNWLKRLFHIGKNDTETNANKII
jgi:hypothetical protein